MLNRARWVLQLFYPAAGCLIENRGNTQEH